MARPRCWWCASPTSRSCWPQHVELYDALLRLNCRRLRLMFDQFEDLNTRPLQARLAKQILLLARSYGIAAGRGDPHRPGSWRRKTWRSCSARRASASTRSSRASSAKAPCASSRRGWSCCRARSCWPSPKRLEARLTDGTLHRHQARRRAATPSTSAALQAYLERELPGFAGPADGRAVQGRAVQPDLQADHAGARLRDAQQARARRRSCCRRRTRSSASSAS